ncbi:MAG TPA: Na+/H+ antiporter NhaA [Candidatus Limnocylindria bacterium]|nr:Na+/H+ antiporter NhaA [Candidatus Limnocylindria bacterium]
MKRSLRVSLGPLIEFLQTESAGGVVLVVASALALAWANIDHAGYDAFWSQPVGPDDWPLALDLHHWINDGAMALFFFVVGLEIKREFVDGELRRPRQAALPVIAALGGMVAPALIYFALNPTGEAARGWGIPMATDIAFAVGVLALAGPHLSVGLKVFLLSFAIVDDIGAIAVIAIFYSAGIDPLWLALAGLACAAFRATWRLDRGISRSAMLLLLGCAAWLAVHNSGVHATIAGVALGFLVPAAPAATPSAAERLAHTLHPWTSFVIVPLFALANAGVAVDVSSLGQAAASPVAMGIFLGLLVGKIVGISGAAYAAVKLNVAVLPKGVTWTQVLGAATLGGIGFTVSLFITQLAFTDAATTASAKISIFAASLVAAVVGFTVLRIARPQVATDD